MIHQINRNCLPKDFQLVVLYNGKRVCEVVTKIFDILVRWTVGRILEIFQQQEGKGIPLF